MLGHLLTVVMLIEFVFRMLLGKGPKLALLLALVLMPCCGRLAMAQIKLSEQKIISYSGLVNPRIVDGQVVADEGSKPVATATSIISVQQVVAYKYFFIEAEALPSFETFDLDKLSEQKLEDGSLQMQFVLPGDAPTGTYRITAQGFDPAMARKRIDVTIGGPTPAPVPIDNTLPPVAQKSRSALQAYANAMADDFDKLFKESSRNAFKTITEAEKAHKANDLKTRDAFKLEMSKVMLEAIGPLEENDPLPPTAGQVFSDIATGFRGAR